MRTVQSFNICVFMSIVFRWWAALGCLLLNLNFACQFLYVAPVLLMVMSVVPQLGYHVFVLGHPWYTCLLQLREYG